MSDKIEIIIKPENEINKQEVETLKDVLTQADITDNAVIMLKEMEQEQDDSKEKAKQHTQLEQLKPLSTAMLHPILEDNEIKCIHGGVVQLKSNLGKEALKNFKYNQSITHYHWSIENAA